MSNTRLTVPVYVCVMLRKDNQILLLHRSNTEHHKDTWAMPGGSIERNETIVDAAIRELFEEVGITLQAHELNLIHVLHAYRPTGDNLGFYFVAHAWHGTPLNKEPDKHSEVAWFALDNLPYNISPSAHQVIEHFKQTPNVQSSTIS